MKPLKVVVVEDDKHGADVLKYLLEKYCPEVEIIVIAKSVKDAIENIAQLEPDIVFLDIELPDGTGFNVLEAFPDHRFSVIFVTAHETYALKAIKMCALDYLLKPVNANDLILALNKVRNERPGDAELKRKEALLHNRHQNAGFKTKVALPATDGLTFVCQEDILYCSADSNYTNFFLKTRKKILVCKSLNYFEEILDDENFCRTHQSYLVNLNYIEKYVKGRGGYLIMSDGTKIEISVRMKNSFLGRFV